MGLLHWIQNCDMELIKTKIASLTIELLREARVANNPTSTRISACQQELSLREL